MSSKVGMTNVQQAIHEMVPFKMTDKTATPKEDLWW
jgi:hypothetical protein